MLKTIKLWLTIGLFSAVVGLGVYISNENFNRMVLPNQPVRIYHMAKQKSGNLQIELLGEDFMMNPVAMEEKVKPYLRLARMRWENIRSNPQLKEQVDGIQRLVVDQWQTLQQTDQVRAVNQWVEEQVKNLEKHKI